MKSEDIPELQSVLTIEEVIGEGTFSTVYKGQLLSQYENQTFQNFAVKCISPVVEPQMLENELKCLTLLNGKHNVVPLLFASRCKDRLALVMPYYEHDRFNRLIRLFKCNHVREYMHQLLIAMDYIHSHNIIHRDVKPNNFLYSTKSNHCALVDFGLAQTVDQSQELSSNKLVEIEEARAPLEDVTSSHVNTVLISKETSSNKPKKRKRESSSSRVPCSCKGHARVCRDCLATPSVNAARAGTAGYRPPEVLLKCVEQSTAVDMWACGVILLSLLSGRPNFFNAPDDLTNLMQLVSLFGKKAVCDAASAMGKRLLVELPENSQQAPASLRETCSRLRAVPLRKGIKIRRWNRVTFPDSAYDLLDKLLTLEPTRRISAADALQHPFISGGVSEQDSFNTSTATVS